MKNVIFALLTLIGIIAAIYGAFYWHLHREIIRTYNVNDDWKIPINTPVNEQEVISSETLWENRSQFIGQIVTVRSKVELYEGCHLSYCPMRCCSNCMGTYELARAGQDENRKSRIRVVTYAENKNKKFYFGCIGGECSMECSPFKPGETYIIKGILKENLDPNYSADPETDLFLFEYLGSE